MTHAPPEDNPPPPTIPGGGEDDIRNAHPARQSEQSGWVRIGGSPHLSPGSLRFDPEVPAKARAQQIARQAVTEPPLGPGDTRQAPKPYAGAETLPETMPAPAEPPPLPQKRKARARLDTPDRSELNHGRGLDTEPSPPHEWIAPLPPALPRLPEALSPPETKVLPEAKLLPDASPLSQGGIVEIDSSCPEGDLSAAIVRKRSGLYFAIFAALVFGGAIAFAASSRVLDAIAPTEAIEGQPAAQETEGIPNP